VHFTIADSAPGLEGVTITQKLPDGYTDSTHGDDVISVAPSFGFVGSPTATDKHGNDYTVTATVQGIPAGESVTFAFDQAEGQPHFNADKPVLPDGACTTVTAATLVCTPDTADPARMTITFNAALPGVTQSDTNGHYQLSASSGAFGDDAQIVVSDGNKP
jgi:hypothetical protein